MPAQPAMKALAAKTSAATTMRTVMFGQPFEPDSVGMAKREMDLLA